MITFPVARLVLQLRWVHYVYARLRVTRTRICYDLRFTLRVYGYVVCYVYTLRYAFTRLPLICYVEHRVVVPTLIGCFWLQLHTTRGFYWLVVAGVVAAHVTVCGPVATRTRFERCGYTRSYSSRLRFYGACGCRGVLAHVAFGYGCWLLVDFATARVGCWFPRVLPRTRVTTHTRGLVTRLRLAWLRYARYVLVVTFTRTLVTHHARLRYVVRLD